MKDDRFLNIENIRLLFQNWKKIIFIPVGVAILTFLLTTVMPQTYRAHATILPPAEDDFASFSSLMSDLPLKALGLGSISSGAEMFLVILKSRTIMESVSEKFNLMALYNEKNMERTVKKLRKHTGANLDDEGTLSLFVDCQTGWFSNAAAKDTARLRSRNMTNYFIHELDRINRNIRSERARNTRIFIERRYEQNITELKAVEDQFIAYQKQHGILVLPEQVSATINSAAEIKAEIMQKEIQLELLESDFGQGNTKSQSIQNEINILQKKYNEMNSGIAVQEANSDNVLLPLNKLPDYGVDYIRFMRDVKIQEKLMEFILPQYEQAKIQEAKDTPTLQVLDWAVKPIHKFKPKRIIFMIFFSFISFLLVLFYIFSWPKLVSLYRDVMHD